MAMTEARMVYELDEQERDAAVSAFKTAHKEAPDFSLVSDRAWIEGYAYAASQQRAMSDEAAGEFADWLCREMPPGTVISDPAWWAPKIMRAILAASSGSKGGGE